MFISQKTNRWAGFFEGKIRSLLKVLDAYAKILAACLRTSIHEHHLRFHRPRGSANAAIKKAGNQAGPPANRALTAISA
jgi:hypothetical protein